MSESFLETAEEDLVVTDYICFDDATKEIIGEGKHEFPGKKYFAKNRKERQKWERYTYLIIR